MLSTRPHAATRSKGKEIAKAPSPPSNLEQEIFKNIYKHINNNFRSSSNPKYQNVDNSLTLDRITQDDRQTEKNVNQNQRAFAVTRNRDTVDEEPTYQELEAHYMYLAKIQKVIPAADEATRPVFNKEPLEQGDSNTTLDSSDMSNNKGEVDHDDVKFQEEHALLAS
ncbi:hypothetical protein Tco_0877655 [Tanacetum coccineum]|uniref:Uncharacterized protein n=1 Tax=Tanacetum coccineum TaxID=301880 RepID=A0ABQ5BXI8_9ASTR